MKLDYWEFITGITKSKFPTTNIKFLFAFLQGTNRGVNVQSAALFNGT